MASTDKPAAPPLAGVRVVEFTENMVGPYIGLLLASLGAEVIKVERPGGESMRTRNKGLFASVNRGKKSVVLDLKQDADKQAAQKLIKSADIVAESFRPGVADKLGIGYKDASAINPRAIFLSISAYGQNGPRKVEPAYDPIIAGYAGIASVMGAPGSPPAYSVNMAIADMAPVFVAVISIMGALMQRQQTGKGQYLDLSMLESALLLMMTRFGSYGMDPKSDGRRVRPGSGVYEAGDGKYLTIHTAETHFWNGLLDVLQEPKLDGLRDTTANQRQDKAEMINEALIARFKQKPREEWMKAMVAKGIPAGPIHDVEEVLQDAQLAARQAFETADGIRFPRFPVRITGLDQVTLGPAQALGADTAALLGEKAKA
jgi:CoA:oxalate CoA-transferase